jgi:Fe2+ or Zn2+ uptake regulation protein
MITNNKKERLTPQRKIIIDYLKSVKTHPTAEEVYSAVKRKLPRISLGTIYRNLQKLKCSGEIREIDCRTCGVTRYDGNMFSHDHFLCEKCNKIFDIKRSVDLKNKIKIGKIKSYQIYFYGICKKCSTK